MSEQPSTSLRVRFARVLGWTGVQVDTDYPTGVGFSPDAPNYRITIPDPTDANTVHETLMGMDADQWRQFVSLLHKRLFGDDLTVSETIAMRLALQTPPPTLAEIYCEVKGVKP